MTRIHLEDYQPPSFDAGHIELYVSIASEEKVEITNTSRLYRRTDAASDSLVLNGSNKLLNLVSLKLDGIPLDKKRYTIDKKTSDLIIRDVPASFSLEIITTVNPRENSECMGMYVSEGIICTQCESEGFRNITYSLDRPDVLSAFTTVIEADKSAFPCLLSNGSRIKAEDLEAGRHRVTWQDTRPKPTYLFALGAGDFDIVKDSFTYEDGRTVELEHYVNKGDAAKALHSIACLKSALQHEQERWGHRYHSSSNLFMTLAVNAFVFGAMENTGFNIFNSMAILADGDTATDERFARIDGIVDHEYCHDESGNWVVPRDWFQISFKEGLTVFRDQCYSEDRYGYTLQRISDVQTIRSSVFAYDSGSMTHPMVLKSYLKIDNNYDVLTYPKGAAVNRMAMTLVGKKAYERAYRSFFDRSATAITTIEAYFKHIAASSGKNLDQFIATWLNQAGVPLLRCKGQFEPSQSSFTLTVKQELPVTADDPGQEKKPFHLPLKLGLVDSDGKDIPLVFAGNANRPDSLLLAEGILEITQTEQSFTFTGITACPRLSLNRDGLAYALIEYDEAFAPGTDDLSFLAVHDCNEFKRWDALQELGVASLQRSITAGEAGNTIHLDQGFLAALENIITDATLAPALKEKMICLPSSLYLANLQKPGSVDPVLIYNCRKQALEEIAGKLQQHFHATYHACQSDAPYEFTPSEMGRRLLANTCLRYLMYSPTNDFTALAREQFLQQHNFSDVMGALGSLMYSSDATARDDALQAMYDKWHHNKLVMNNWLSLQALAPYSSAKEVSKLAQSHVFDYKNPNNVYSLIGAFAGNTPNFHKKDGSGYRFLSDWIVKLDNISAAVASRLAGVFTRIKDYQPWRQELMKQEMQRVYDARGASLSDNTREILDRCMV